MLGESTEHSGLVWLEYRAHSSKRLMGDEARKMDGGLAPDCWIWLAKAAGIEETIGVCEAGMWCGQIWVLVARRGGLGEKGAACLWSSPKRRKLQSLNGTINTLQG